MCQTIKLRAQLRNSLYQEDKCEWKAFSAHIQKLVQWATTWACLPHPLPHILIQSQLQKDLTPTAFAGAGSRHPCSLWRQQHLLGLDVSNTTGFEANTLSSSWKARPMPDREKMLLNLLLEWEYPTSSASHWPWVAWTEMGSEGARDTDHHAEWVALYQNC